MRILYFGVYEPSYARNWVLINGLKKNGDDILELRQEPGRFALFKLFFSYLKFKQDYDAMIVGFPGQEVMFLARLLVWLLRLGSHSSLSLRAHPSESKTGQVKPIIFDAFTSHYGGYILDRKRWKKKGIRARYFKFLDKWSCKLADVVLLDTDAHINFFVQNFKLSKEKFRRIWIGANDDNFKPINRQDLFKQVLPVNDKFKVMFFGTYIPLQGAEYIVRAAKLLERETDIIFYFIGKGQDKYRCVNLVKELGLKNIEFTDMIKPEELRLRIASADVVLGLFGNTPKTPLVIPNKIYEATAMKKPVITSDTPAIRELFSEGDMLLIGAANPDEIAKAISKLKNDPNLRGKIAENGYAKFKNNASSMILGSQLKLIIEECVKNKKS